MAKEVSSSPVTVYSILAPGAKIMGDISSDTDLRLDGVMEGNIVSEGKVILGPASSIIGNITCSNAEISGTAAFLLVPVLFRKKMMPPMAAAAAVT